MIKSRNVNIIDRYDWDKLVTDTYGKPYSIQQQDGCMDRQMIGLTIPDEADDYENDTLPEEVNHPKMGVSFAAWLARDPNQPLNTTDVLRSDFGLTLWWNRNFYPDLQTLANDLHAKGLIEAGEYSINIDW